MILDSGLLVWATLYVLSRIQFNLAETNVVQHCSCNASRITFGCTETHKRKMPETGMLKFVSLLYSRQGALWKSLTWVFRH